MNRKVEILFWLLILIIISCQIEKVTDEFLVVEKYNEKYLEDSSKFAPYDYYVGNNIILPEESGQVFYHDTRLLCGTGWKVSNPPIPINFERNPLLKFKSVDEFSKFFKNHTSTPRLVMFVSNSDTIRNKNYFELVDTLEKIRSTYIVARRKITQDELDAISNSRIVSIDMHKKCNLDDLSVIQYNLIKNENFEDQLNRFFDLSENYCQYYFDYGILYEELLYQLILKAPKEFLNQCDSIGNNQKRNISIALQGSTLVKDSIILQAYKLLQQTEDYSNKWVLENIEKRLGIIIN